MQIDGVVGYAEQKPEPAAVLPWRPSPPACRPPAALIPRPWPRNYGSHVHNLHKSMQYMRNAMSLSQLIYAACVCVCVWVAVRVCCLHVSCLSPNPFCYVMWHRFGWVFGWV